MKKMLRVLAAVLAILMLTIGMTVCMTGCGDDSDDVVVIEPAGKDEAVTKQTATQEPPKNLNMGRMNASHLLSIYGTLMNWYDVMGFEHTEETPGKAVFPVICGENLTGTLEVDYNPDTAEVSRADMTLNDVTVSLLSDDLTVLKPIMDEMRKG